MLFQAVKINKWDGAAAKNAVDDAIREVNLFSIRQNFNKNINNVFIEKCLLYPYPSAA